MTTSTRPTARCYTIDPEALAAVQVWHPQYQNNWFDYSWYEALLDDARFDLFRGGLVLTIHKDGPLAGGAMSILYCLREGRILHEDSIHDTAIFELALRGEADLESQIVARQAGLNCPLVLHEIAELTALRRERFCRGATVSVDSISCRIQRNFHWDIHELTIQPFPDYPTAADELERDLTAAFTAEQLQRSDIHRWHQVLAIAQAIGNSPVLMNAIIRQPTGQPLGSP